MNMRSKNSVSTELALAKTQVELKKQEIELEKVKSLGTVPNGELAIYARCIINSIKWIGLILVILTITCGAQQIIKAVDFNNVTNEQMKDKINELVIKSNKLSKKVDDIRFGTYTVPVNNKLEYPKPFTNYVELPIEE